MAVTGPTKVATCEDAEYVLKKFYAKTSCKMIITKSMPPDDYPWDPKVKYLILFE